MNNINKIRRFINKYSGYYFFVLLLIVIILDYKHLLKMNIINNSNDVIYAFTFVAILWYSYETLKLKEATYKLVDIQIAPVVTVVAKTNGLFLKNIGNGSVLSFFIESFAFVSQSKTNRKIDHSNFDSLNTLSPSEEKQLNFDIIIGKKKYDYQTIKSLLDKECDKMDLIINYWDINHEEYLSRIIISKNEIKLIWYRKIS